MYKMIIVGASAGGKSTLMRYLREHTKLHIAEMDEEIVKLNGGRWPTDDNYRNTVLVPKITKKIIKMEDVVYLSSYVPDELVAEAKNKGFTIVLLEVRLEQLEARNTKRILEEKYETVAIYFDAQLKGFKRLQDNGLIDKTIDGHKTTKEIADEVSELAGA